MFDYHVHSTFSVDCNIPMEESCRAAIAAGVTEIAITDHVDHVPADLGFGYYRPDEYLRELDAVRETYAGELTVLRGMEVDYNDSTVEEVARFIDRYGDRYDFVIGSVHYFSDGSMIFPDNFAGKSLDDVFLPYLDQVERAVDTGWFDSIGHLDLPKRYAPKTHRDYDPAHYRERLLPIFDTMIARGVGFEINTSGLRQTPRTSMPSGAIVRWYAERGGRIITTGTDSHAAQTVGAGLAKTLDNVFLPYLDQVERAVGTGWFDSIGHLDLPKRYAPKTHRDYDPARYRERLLPIFDVMIARGVGFEINTSGLRQTPRTSMPSGAIVRWYAERGGRIITTGTDSHAAQTVGAGLAKTLDMLTLCGIDSVASFRNRTATLTPISTLRPEEA